MKSEYKSGKTPLIKSPVLSKEFGLDNLYIKDESKNPFGTFKDRRSEKIFHEASKKKVNKLAIITSGNACYSLARYTKNTKLKTVCIVDKNLKKSIRNEIKKHAYRIIETDLLKKKLGPKEVEKIVRENDAEIIWDVSNGFHHSYIDIIKEIKNKKPEYLIVPIGSGEAFVGLYEGIKKYKLKTKLIGVGIKSKLYSFADKLHTKWTPYKSKIQKILKERHIIIRLKEEEIKKIYNKIKRIINCEPSSAVAFAALYKIRFDKEDIIIIINSGKGVL